MTGQNSQLDLFEGLGKNSRIGKALAPRLIAALGTQRERFPDASSIQSYRASRPCAKLAASANGCTLGGQVRSSSSRRFRNGPSIR